MKNMVINIIGCIIIIILTIIILFLISGNYEKAEETSSEIEDIKEDEEKLDWEYPVDLGQGKGKFAIYVTNGNGQGLDNSRFEISDKEGNKIASLGTNEKGLTGVKGLKNGTYYIEQIYVKDNYEMDNKRYVLEITDDKYDFVQRIKNEIKNRSSLLIVLEDDEKKPIQGSKFELYKNDEKILELTTNEKGLAGAENLNLGNYYIKQISTKEGYKINEEKNSFTVTEEEQIIRKDIVNKREE